jgi:hypothetical protein
MVVWTFYFGDELKAVFIFFENDMYNNIVMSAQDWAGFIFTILSIGGIILGGIRWYIKIQIGPIKEVVEDIRSETKTNGGSSMRDEIKSIKAQQELDRKLSIEQKAKLDHMYDILLEYISKNNK